MYRRPGIASSTAVISFSVSVPVLSELIADVEPSVSVERSRFMIAFASASFCVPIERIAVTTAGRPVGMAAMANAIAARNTVLNDSPRDMLSTIEITSAEPEMTRIWLVSLFSCFVSGEAASLSWASIPEMWPTSVAMPVVVTTKSPDPRVTFVFM